MNSSYVFHGGHAKWCSSSLCIRPQEQYLSRMVALMDMFYSKGEDIEHEAWRLWDERYNITKLSDRPWVDIGWLQRRRSNMERWQYYCTSWQKKIRAEGRLLASQINSLLEATSAFLCPDIYQLEPWVKDVMAEALSQESEHIRWLCSRWDQDCWTQQLDHHEARDNYRTWIAHFSGKAQSQGLPTSRDEEPEALLNEFPCDFGDQEFAKKFMWIGGYQAPSQVDKHGWTALMHACDFLVYWTKAFETCRGLIAQMQPEELDLAAVGRNMVGYTALHLICQNSDRTKRKAELAEIMLRRGAKVDPRTEASGSTPFHFAVGTGIVDVVKVLVLHRCDVDAETIERQGKPRRNAADMCWSSSGSMHEYLRS